MRWIELGEPVAGVAQPWEAKALTYLERGAVLLSSPSLDDDVLGAGRKKIGGWAIQTDGTWAWTSHLTYYLRNYHVALPPDFVAHMTARHWAPPDLDADALSDAARRAGIDPPDGDAPVLDAEDR